MFDPTIRAVAKSCLTILAQAVIVGLTLIGLIVISLAVNRVLQFAIEVFNVGDNTGQVLSFMTFGYFVVVALAMMLIGIHDVWRVLRTSVGSPSDVEDDDEKVDN